MDKKMGYFKNLYVNHREYALLQWLYAIIALLGLFISGIVALMNQTLGISILIVPGIFSIAFVANLVAWSLLNTVLKSLFSGDRKKEK
ncbi:hypothetical protein IJ096_01510 [Candidatus Saccharibacteria bacterium]|nr:hypothetical protein [Candidatus Saccharibacteria bacterium]